MSTAPTAPSSPVSPASVIDALREEAARLLDELWAAKLPTELLNVVCSIEKLKSTLEAVELTVVDEIELSDAAKTEAWASTKDFVTAVSGGTRASGPGTVRLARSLRTDCTLTLQALGKGWLSLTKARVIVRTIELLPVNRVVRLEAEETLLQHARSLDATDLAEVGKHIIEVVDPDGDERREERKLSREERAAHLGRFLSIVEDGMGGVRIKGRTSVEDGAVIKSALMSLAAPNPTKPGSCGGHDVCPEDSCAHNGRDPRDHGVRTLDALVEACRRLEDAKVLPESHGAKPRLNLTMNYQDLLEQIGTGTLETGERLSASVVRRLACDAEVIPMVLGSHSEILDVGRLQRLVTAVIWGALVVRDRHCTFPGCARPPIACDAHHLVSWLDGGKTSLSNLALLCRGHHTVLHNSPWEMQMNPVDQRPEFIPPERVDRRRKPARHRFPRE